MKRITTLIGCILLTGMQLFWSQDQTSKPTSLSIPGAVNVRMNAAGTAPAFVVFDADRAFSLEKLPELKRQLFGSREDDTWEEIRSETDNIGMVHTRYQQVYKAIPVDGHIYIFHSKEGKILSANGTFAPNLNLSVVPSITADQALGFALTGMKQPLSADQVSLTDKELVIVRSDQNQLLLAYKCAVLSETPHVNVVVYIDAHTGKVLREISQICSTDVPGTAHTGFSGVQPITANQTGGHFELSETGRGSGIQTYKTSTSQLYTDNDNTWNNVNAQMDEYATDAHFGAEATYDFYYDHFGRDSYDNNGGIIISNVNDEGVGVNAYWSGGPQNTMHYGSGDATDYFPVVSLEVVGHELTHGVTEYSAGLQYAGESGALNESFSDIFGNTIRFLNAPTVATWFIGDQIIRPGSAGHPFRNMANPNQFECPDTYGGLFFNNGDIVHYDSGIQNFWYYLLVEGGNGTNDVNNAYDVEAIGMQDAMKIAYRNLAYYLTPLSSFADARDGSEQAAADLFGLCSEQHKEVVNAWYAVNVGGPEMLNGAEAVFTNTENFACSAPLTSHFTAEGIYNSYTWDFGDGQTGTGATSSHTYTATGNYTVTLVVTHTVCQLSDTLTVEGAVVIGELDPIAAFTIPAAVITLPVTFTDQTQYGPESWQWSFGDGGTSTLQNPVHTYAAEGTYNVQLIVTNCHGTDTITQTIEVRGPLTMCDDLATEHPVGIIYDSGGPGGNYGDDEYCFIAIEPCNASTITLTIEELNIGEGDYLYVLSNQDTWNVIGFFPFMDPSVPLVSTTGKMYLNFMSNGNTTSSGFKASYVSTIEFPDSQSAAFTMNPTLPLEGEAILFTDASGNNPIAWEWNFGDGQTSTQQNNYHAYFQHGTYTVTLKVFYCDGTVDTFSKDVVVGGVGLEEQEVSLLTIFPNPFGSSFTIAGGAELQQLSVRLFDLNGRLVYQQQEQIVPAEGVTVTPVNLSNGHYLLEAQYEYNGVLQLERTKIVVSH